MAGRDEISSECPSALRRHRRALSFALLAALAIAGAQSASAVLPGVTTTAQTAAPPAVRLLVAQRALQVDEPGYRLAVDPQTGVMDIASPHGLLYTSAPLTALAGRTSFPAGTVSHVVRTPTGLRTDTVGPDGRVLVSAAVTTAPGSFTVRFTALVGPDGGPVALFFHDGSRGLEQTTIGAGFTPDANQRADSRYPSIDTSVRTPLAPAPLDLQVRAAPGWMGIGLVQVPNAGSLALARNGAVQIDYPLAPLAAEGAPLVFPDFVFTFAPTPLDGLRAYHDALVDLGAAPVSATEGPSWWHDPIVDTWGEQVATGAARASPKFTAAWVRAFVQDVRARYGLGHATIVIDSAWQRQIGEPEPDPTRFGSWTGMRQLIDTLHAQGYHVLLWWPMWALDIRSIPARKADFVTGSGHFLDPAAAGFDAAMAATVTRLLGTDASGLAADGLKLDWSYDIPAGLSDPADSGGAAALYHYLDVIHSAAGRVHPGSIIEASAASPQFERVTDSIRLYDAWNQRDWERRAAIVAAADPGQLVDGDGWETAPANAVAHAVTSTVYGVPALYFGAHWGDGSPVDPGTAQVIGAVMGLASQKRDGTATLTPDGWRWNGVDGTTVSTLASNTLLLVWHPAHCGGTGTAVATVPGTYAIPLGLPSGATLTIAPHDRAASVSRQGATTLLSLAAGRPVELRAAC